jgi:pilus assembly protein FimV
MRAFAFLSATLLWMTVLLNVPAQAAGLGELVVHSALGQPLEAKVEITGLRGKEFESLTVASATPELFKQRGLTYTAIARNLRYAPVKREDGSAYLKISSVQAINEPSVDLLIDFAWPGGRLLQKYSLLLDLPVR